MRRLNRRPVRETERAGRDDPASPFTILTATTAVRSRLPLGPPCTGSSRFRCPHQCHRQRQGGRRFIGLREPLGERYFGSILPFLAQGSSSATMPTVSCPHCQGRSHPSRPGENSQATLFADRRHQPGLCLLARRHRGTFHGSQLLWSLDEATEVGSATLEGMSAGWRTNRPFVFARGEHPSTISLQYCSHSDATVCRRTNHVGAAGPQRCPPTSRTLSGVPK